MQDEQESGLKLGAIRTERRVVNSTRLSLESSMQLKGLMHRQSTATYSPQQNGVVER
jgi:hypothetical protein